MTGGGEDEVHDPIKKRREARIRRLLADPRLMEQAGRNAGAVRDEEWEAWRRPATFRQFAGKWLLCLVLYGAAWAVFHIEHPALHPAREAIRRSLTDSFPFDAAAAWYHRHIGDWPALLPAFGERGTEARAAYARPAAGQVARPFGDASSGVTLVTPPGEDVRAAGEGLVVRVLEAPDTGLTVTVRHKAGLETIYGRLVHVRVRERDWLAAGEVIGTVTDEPDGRSGRLYFAVRQNGAYVDPRDVISFD